MSSETQQNFQGVKSRLDEIVDEVSTDDISLDEALDLYEEAVKLGMQISDLLEEEITEKEEDVSNAKDAGLGEVADEDMQVSKLAKEGHTEENSSTEV